MKRSYSLSKLSRARSTPDYFWFPGKFVVLFFFYKIYNDLKYTLR